MFSYFLEQNSSTSQQNSSASQGTGDLPHVLALLVRELRHVVGRVHQDQPSIFVFLLNAEVHVGIESTVFTFLVTSHDLEFA